MLAKTRGRKRRGERGAELIEMALVLPLLLLVVLGIADFAFLFQRYEVLTNAAREGARVATLPGYAAIDIQNRVQSFVDAGGLPTTPGNPLVTVSTTTIGTPPNDWTATTVDVAYTHDYMFLGGLPGWFGGGSFGSVTLEAESTMRNEMEP